MTDRQWAIEIIDRVKSQIVDAFRVYHASREGLFHARHMPELYDAALSVQNPPGSTLNVPPAFLEAVAQTAEFSRSEIDSDYATLNASCVGTLWSALDAHIPDLVVAFLVNVPDLLKNKRFQKVTISVSEFQRLTTDERMAHLVTMMSRGSETKRGISRHEDILALANLSGALDADLRRNLVELVEIRNIIVHRASIVDRKAADACVWMKLRVGAKHQVTSNDVSRYLGAVVAYLDLLQARVANWTPAVSE